MTNPQDLKRKVSEAVLTKVKGVSGVGLPNQKLTIYLESDDPDVRQEVQRAIAPLALDMPPEMVVTGKFSRM